MKTLTPLSLAVLSALFSTAGHAAIVTGRVVDLNNNPVPEAQVHYHGKENAVYTDKNGYFSLDIDAAGELHVSKQDFLDGRVLISPDSAQLEIRLSPSTVENIVVYASGLHKSTLEMTSPVTVLAGDDLRTQAKPTLGETLKSIPGVNASYFGPVSSSPVIRGLDGPRVKITQNGLDSGDASRVGPDHATSVESLAAEQIEVLRGPATLLYGSGAIGGVVNIVDNRIPSDTIDAVAGAVEYSHDSVSNANTLAAKLEAGLEGVNLHFDGVKRSGDDYKTPTFVIKAQHEEDSDEVLDKVENTFIESETFNVGTSVVKEHVTLGLSYGQIDTDYGVPGHHGGHGHGDESAPDAGAAVTVEEVPVFARLKQQRWQMLARYSLHDSWLETLTLRAGYTDYRHSEIEDGETGTTFLNKTKEARFNAEHRLSQWHGTLGYHFSDSDYRAIGEEAFTPGTQTVSHALYILEERQFDSITLELGARVEDYSLDSLITEHTHEGEPVNLDGHAFSYNDTNISASLGTVWEFAEGYNTALSLSHSQRSPLTGELLSNGLHIATNTYELGLGYEIEGADVHFHGDDIAQESSNNLDLSLRKYGGDFGYTLNLFYNDIDNYYYQQNTGLYFDAHDGFSTAADEEALPVFQYRAADARLYGLELDAHMQLSDTLTLKVFGDHLNAKLKDAGYLPRIPANKLGTSLEFSQGAWLAQITATRYLDQNKIADYETGTTGYTLFDASISYDLEMDGKDGTLYLNLDNISDELGFVHTSFIKEQAPLPGRNIRFGARIYF